MILTPAGRAGGRYILSLAGLPAAGSMAGALSKLLYLRAIAEARHLVANRRSAGIPLPAIRQYADAQLTVFLVVDNGAGDQYDLAAGLRGEAHAVAGIKGRLHTLLISAYP